VHVYVKNPKNGFSCANERLGYLAQSNVKMPKISIIYSSEILFMGGWLKYNSLKKAEQIFIKSLRDYDKKLFSKIDFTDFTYYNYNNLSKSIKYYNRLKKKNSLRKVKKDELILASK
jgi:hypothetical protein